MYLRYIVDSLQKCTF